MKEPTGNIEAEVESYRKHIRRLEQDNEEYRHELEIANRAITHLEAVVEAFKYQAFVNDKSRDDWK